MYRPSTLRLFSLFARTAAQRFCNRFLYAWQKKAEARRKKRNLPEPERTATAHRHQRFRPGNLLAVLFMAYMMFAICMAMNVSFGDAADGVRSARQPSLVRRDFGQDSDPDGKDAAPRPHPYHESLDLIERMNGETRLTTEKVTALMMLIAGVGTLLFNIGMLSRQITRPEPALAWLFEFPVPRPVLFATRLCEGLFDGASLPLLSMLPGIWLFHRGYSFWASAGWGLAFGALMAFTVAAARLAVEVLLLQKCQRRRRGTIAGLCAAAGALLMVIVLYGGKTPALVSALVNAADRLPDWFFHNPFSAGFGTDITVSAASWLSAAAVVAVLCTVSVFFASRLTRFGLEPGLDTVRGSPEAAKTAGRMFSGLIGKELLMLVRQRTVMVQVILAPVIMVMMMYFQSSGHLAERVLGSEGALASAVYGICAYMVLIASQVAMNMELRTLWLLLSLPRPLADSLRMKSRIWGLAATVLALVLAVASVIVYPALAPGLLYRLPFLLLFIVLIADLSVGIRTMGSSIVSETTVHFRQWAAWLPLALSAGAGQAIFGGDAWILCVQLVLLGALDVSVWQKLNAELPWLTEPAEDPPPRLYLMHGQLAAYGYFVLQTLGFALFAQSGLPPGILITVASALSAALVAALTLWILQRRKVRILPQNPAPPFRSAFYAVAGLVAGAAAGFLWLHLIQSWSWASELLKRSAPSLGFPNDDANWWGIVALAVVVAPVCEEFIFRGLIYHGLRRTGGVGWSILWSSLFFTAVHPPVSSVAVFTLAAINAFVVERTGRLTPAILIHAGYNTFMIWLQTRG